MSHMWHGISATCVGPDQGLGPVSWEVSDGGSDGSVMGGQGGGLGGGLDGPWEQGCDAKQHLVEDASAQTAGKIIWSPLKEAFQIKDCSNHSL